MATTRTLEHELLDLGVQVRHLEIDLAHADSATRVLDAPQGGGLAGHSG